jgi:hypothetical protein
MESFWSWRPTARKAETGIDAGSMNGLAFFSGLKLAY